MRVGAAVASLADGDDSISSSGSEVSDSDSESCASFQIFKLLFLNFISF